MYITIHMNEDNMVHERLNITLHPEVIEKLDRICKNRGYRRSSMIAILIQEYEEKVK